MFVNMRNTFRKVFTFIHVYVNTFRKFHESPKHSTNSFVQHNLIEIFRYHKYTSRVWIHHNYYSAYYWTFVSYPYGILWDIWDTFRKVLPNYPWTRHSSTLVRVSPKKKESNKNLPLDPCLTFFRNFVQMNALRMLKASKKVCWTNHNNAWLCVTSVWQHNCKWLKGSYRDKSWWVTNQKHWEKKQQIIISWQK